MLGWRQRAIAGELMEATVMLFIILVLRLVAATVLGLLALALFRGSSGNRAYHTAGFLACCIIGYLLVPVLSQYPLLMPVTVLAAGIAALAPVMLWACAGNVFDDHFATPPVAYPLGAITVALGVAALLVQQEPLARWLDLAALGVWLAWLVIAMLTILHDREGDLVEARRRLRLLVAAAVILLPLATAGLRFALPGPLPIAVEVTQLCVFLLLTIALAGHMLTLRPDNLFTRISARRGVPHDKLSPLAHRLQATMEEERLHATEGLTLDILAERLNMQPQRLRHVIHHELGHRSFSAFVNLYRVKEVASRLAEPENRDTPLMTIARDAGFSSMTPLNRTFRARYKISPNAYRDKVQGEG